MSAQTRTTIMSVMVLFVLVFSAVFTAPALADEETPPPPDAAAAIDSGTAPAVSADSASAISEALPELPPGSELIVVDGSGEAVPLATQQAAEIIAGADPIWCPTGVTPDVLNPACGVSYLNLAALVAGPAPTGNGVIWIQFGADSSAGVITINGAGLWSTAAAFSLTLKGGWSGTMGTTTTNPLTPSTFTKRISIANWLGDVTLSDIVISAAPGGDGLLVDTTKNIVLTRVTSQSNPAGMGAYLDNSGGTGTVTVTSSQFNLNAGNGLLVQSSHSITLSNVTASGNTAGTGAALDNEAVSSPQNVVVSGVNTFDDNFNDGLNITTRGSITGNDISANGNGTSGVTGSGVWLVNSTASTAQPVTLTGTSILTENRDGGLYINSIGAIKLNNVNANATTNGYGAQVSNNGALTAQPVTLTGTSTFKFNSTAGLFVYSKGMITVNNLRADLNANGSGVTLFNDYASFSSGVIMTGQNYFNDNYSNGLAVTSRGTITAANLTANGNGSGVYGIGALLSNYNAVTAKSITLTGSNTFNGNYTEGLNLSSKGGINASNVTANDTVNGVGGDLANYDATSAQAVKLTGVNSFLNNYTSGLSIQSIGAISVNSINASGNGFGGASGHGVQLDNSAAGTAPGITLAGTNITSDNYSSGLYVTSSGVIAIHSLTASGNGLTAPSNGFGAHISNTAGTTAGVTFNGTNVFLGNRNDGLNITSRGKVVLSNINSSGSVLGYGLSASNLTSGMATPKDITLSGVNLFNDNYSSGLELYSFGALSLSNVTASGNSPISSYGYGALLSNETGTIAKSVTVTGVNTFSGNHNDGLQVRSLGAVKINSMAASGNLARGADLNNSYGTALAGITLSGSSILENNDDDGLYLVSAGIVITSNLTANGNGSSGSGYGAYIDNTGVVTKTVTLSGVNHFDGNKSGGLTVASSGTITASNLNASSSISGTGVYLHNDIGPSAAGITLTGVNVFNSNYNSGLSVGSFGTINLNTTTISANQNGATLGNGVYLNNSSALTPKAVTLKGTNILLGNYNVGFQVNSKGAIAVNNLTASETVFGEGALLTNTVAGAVGGITVTGTNLMKSNYYSGLHAESHGAISVNNVTADENGQSGASGYGVDLQNGTAATPMSVTLTGTNTFNDNYSDGLTIATKGAVKANNLTASRNTNGGGVAIDNLNGSSASAVSPGVTLTGKNLIEDNLYNGLQIMSYGPIALSNVSANGNGNAGFGSGINLFNTNLVAPKNITLSGTNILNDNSLSGLYISGTTGAISVNNLTANGNDVGYGANLSNSVGTANVSLTGINTFSGNNAGGLQISSQGAVNLTKVIADDNGAAGLVVNTSGNITLTCGRFISNTTYGVRLNTPLTATVIGVISAGNPSGNTDLAGGGGPVVTVRNCPLP